MNRSTFRFRLVAFAVVSLAAACHGIGRAEEDASRHFKMTITSQMTMTIEGQKQEIIADTTLAYVNRRRGREVSVQFEEVLVKASNNGQELMNTLMKATGVTNVKDGQTKEVRADDASEEVKKMLKASFEKPICVVEVDAEGIETKRTVSDDPGAKSLVDNGLVAGARLFHAPFPANESKWQADREVSMGSGGYARGKLTYEKVPESSPGQTAVKVSGELRCDSFTPAGSPATIKQARYRVAGEQVYDDARREWTSGNLVMKVAFDLVQGEKDLGAAVGTMNVVLRSLTGK